jgi:P4 family phage/plasmid primase-like protien
MTTIPEQLKNEKFRFVLINSREKTPFELEWNTKNNYTYDNPKLLEHLSRDGNYGVLCGNGLIVVDSDTEKLDEKLQSLPQTFTVKTSKGKHYYFFCKNCEKSFTILKNKKHYGEVQSTGKCVVGPNSIHPSGIVYQVINDVPIVEVTFEQLKESLKSFLPKNKFGRGITVTTTTAAKTIPENIKELIENGVEEGQRNLNTWIIVKELYKLKYDPLVIEKIVLEFNAKCRPPRDIAEVKNHVNYLLRNPKYLSDELTFEEVERLIEQKISEETNWKKNIGEYIVQYLNYVDMAEQFWKIQPFFFDRAKNWWMWNKEKCCWEMMDETDLMNEIDKALLVGLATTKSNIKNEILEGLKRTGRLRIPKNIKETWVQFNKIIIDVRTGEQIVSTPEYFSTNSIPWTLGDSEGTPTIDRLFKEWVGEKFVPVLYEIVAYCFLPGYPIGRIFCFIGIGLNGKTTFLNLLAKMVGKDNCSSANLDLLLKSRFESCRLYKKLVCIMGETNFVTLSRTDTLKRLTGQDLIGFEFKNKDPFQDYNYAKIIIATNSLPMTTDRTIGFYRRWLCIDFPNQFSEKKDILSTIPEEEYRNLARKSMRILKELLEKREFTNEGTVEERKKTYESLSNPILNFIKEKYEKDVNGMELFSEFEESFILYLKEKGLREMSSTEIGRALTREGFMRRGKTVENEYGGRTTKYYILGLRKWKVQKDLNDTFGD